MSFPVHLRLWFNFLFLWASKIDANVSNLSVCQDITHTDPVFYPEQDEIEAEDIKEESLCLFYPTNVLNCSWSLDHVQAAHIVPLISICDGETLLESWNRSTEERVGSASFVLKDAAVLYVVLQFNITLQGYWTVYTKAYDKHNLEVPPPPGNISTRLEDTDLLVTWSLPKTGISKKPACFKYELDIGDGEPFKNTSGTQSYRVENMDREQTYWVRMRARLSDACQADPHWSEWSHVSVVEAVTSRLSWLVIVLILLGIPMILLALLLLVRHQRVRKTFFPPIPRPPPKYMYFLEKNDGLNIYHPRTPVEEEVITVVLYE